MSTDDIEPEKEESGRDELGVEGEAGQWFDEDYKPPRAATEQIQPKTTHPMVYISTLLILGSIVGAIYYYMTVTEEARRRAAEIDTVLSVEDLASGLQSSTLPAFLKTLNQQDEKLREIENAVYKKFPATDDPTERRYRAEMVADEDTFLDGFLNELIRNIDEAPGSSYWSYRPKDEFRLLVQQTLVSCASISAKTCIHKLSYIPLMEHIGELHDFKSGAPLPWIFIVTDAKGTGLADAHAANWSDKKNFGDNTEGLQEAIQKKASSRSQFKHSVTGKTIDSFVFPLNHGSELVGAALTGILNPPEKQQ